MTEKLTDITLLMAILITIIIIYFFSSILRYHKRYVRLQKDLIDAEIKMQENERKRIANDLHDSIGPMLSAVKMNINCISPDTVEDELVIKKSSKYIDEIITNLRRISHNLLPNTFERQGVFEALKEFMKDIQNKHAVSFELKIENEVNIPSEKGIHIFRILQEIIHNTLKHAEAKTMQITVNAIGDTLHISTRDDGKGFNAETGRNESSGLGLKSIKSRVDLLNGKLTLETAINKGTAYFLEIPV